MTGPGIVEQTLESLGIEITDVSGDELQAHCPAHKQRTGKEDHNPSWYVNADSGMHICFSCGFKGSLTYLIMVVKGWDDAQARSYVGNLDSVVDLDVINQKLDAALNRDAFPARRQPPIPRSQLALFVEPPAWALRERGLTAEACEAYGVLWDDKRAAWITPLYDPDSLELIGWQSKGQLDRWFKNVPPTMKKSSTLFGWNLAAPEHVKEVVAVESPLDAVRVYAVTRGTIGVAFCGATFSEKQSQLLRLFHRAVVAFDNPRWDEAGLKAIQAMKTRSLNPLYFDYADSDAKDIGEMRAADIRAGIANAMLFVDDRGQRPRWMHQ